MSAEVAWESRYKNATAFLDEHVQFDQFKTRLKDHRKQVSMKNSNKKRKVTISAASGLTPRKKKWTWRSSKSRALIMNDLIFKKISIHENIISAETLWEERYKNAKAFVEEKIPFEQFKARLKDHRSQVSKQRSRVIDDAGAVRRHRTLFPRKKRNNRGELVFDFHPAKEFLRADIKEGLHTGKTLAQFWSTCKEYQEFDAKILRQRIYQEIKYTKFVNHLEIRRKQGKF